MAIIEYNATEDPPNIIGPTAPIGTEGPWEIHNVTILVRNIAGNTDAKPAIKGYPRSEIQTAAPMANAAIKPLDISAYLLTLLLLDGVGPIFQQNTIPRITTANNPRRAIPYDDKPFLVTTFIKFNANILHNNHINNEIIIIIINVVYLLLVTLK